MENCGYYVIVEIPKEYTEKEVDDIKSVVEGAIGDWRYNPEKPPITIKKCYWQNSNS